VLVDRVDATSLAVETWVYLEDQALADELLASGSSQEHRPVLRMRLASDRLAGMR
jgi:hypothetical protein